MQYLTLIFPEIHPEWIQKQERSKKFNQVIICCIDVRKNKLQKFVMKF